MVDLAFGFLSALQKSNPYAVAFSSSGQALTLSQDIRATVNGLLRKFTSGSAIAAPSLVAGTDYAIYACADGTLQASANFSAPTGYDPTAVYKIGGFHYAPGGNATAMSGGDSAPKINSYSMWDLKWRPACIDPRGMTLVAGAFWCDIYLLGVDHHVNGTTKYNVMIADGGSPPKIPTAFGGDGTATYSNGSLWTMAEVLSAYGKRLLSYRDFAAAAYGTTENSSYGADPVSTILRPAYTSKWGVMLASGNMWVWGNEFGGGAAGASWADSNGGRGQVYQQPNAALFGGYWDNGSSCGSRASSWSNAPWNSYGLFGARGRCDHLFHV